MVLGDEACGVGGTMRLHIQRQAACEVFPPDAEVPAGGGDLVLVLSEGSTLQV